MIQKLLQIDEVTIENIKLAYEMCGKRPANYLWLEGYFACPLAAIFLANGGFNTYNKSISIAEWAHNYFGRIFVESFTAGFDDIILSTVNDIEAYELGIKARKEVLEKVIAEKIDQYLEALQWCSGSNDFNEEGKTREGWLRYAQPLLDELK